MFTSDIILQFKEYCKKIKFKNKNRNVKKYK